MLEGWCLRHSLHPCRWVGGWGGGGKYSRFLAPPNRKMWGRPPRLSDSPGPWAPADQLTLHRELVSVHAALSSPRSCSIKSSQPVSFCLLSSRDIRPPPWSRLELQLETWAGSELGWSWAHLTTPFKEVSEDHQRDTSRCPAHVRAAGMGSVDDMAAPAPPAPPWTYHHLAITETLTGWSSPVPWQDSWGYTWTHLGSAQGSFSPDEMPQPLVRRPLPRLRHPFPKGQGVLGERSSEFGKKSIPLAHDHMLEQVFRFQTCL